MNDTFVYKRKRGRGAVWLAAVTAAAVGAGVWWLGLTDLLTVFALFCALTLGWIMSPRPVYGIKVDDTHLTLAAFRKPRPIPLDSIAHIQATEADDENAYVIIYRDGEKEGIFALDLPDEETLVEILAERGIPVRGRI